MNNLTTQELIEMVTETRIKLALSALELERLTLELRRRIEEGATLDHPC